MKAMKKQEKRGGERQVVGERVEVNGGLPFRGGTLHDISVSGAAVSYGKDVMPTGAPPKAGDRLDLLVNGVTKLPAQVARTFDGGYAVEFNWGVDLTDAFR